jgi:hypothetical protein
LRRRWRWLRVPEGNGFIGGDFRQFEPPVPPIQRGAGWLAAQSLGDIVAILGRNPTLVGPKKATASRSIRRGTRLDDSLVKSLTKAADFPLYVF